MRIRLAIGAVAPALCALFGTPLQARQVVLPIGGERYPLAPAIERGEGVAPFFDGFYTNPDGSHTFSFGFMNRNQREVLEVPIGPNNFITPAQFNGIQPTYFPPVSAPGGFGGRRERGAFAITVPPGFTGDVVWTVTANGKTYSVPGRVGGAAYELSYTPQAAGSLMPSVKFAATGAVSKGREGVVHGPLSARVGVPLTIDFWVQDHGERAPVRVGYTWWKHQAPPGADVQFTPASGQSPEAGGGQLSTTVLFSQPGEYMLRVRVDNHGARDSTHGNNCCWANGYVKVNVTP